MKTKAMDGHATIITCVSGYSSQRATGPRRAFYSITKGTYAFDQHQFHQERCLVDGATE